MSKDVETNIYFEITTRSNRKKKITLRLPKDEVDAGVYDFAQVNLGNGIEEFCVCWLSEVLSAEDEGKS